MELLFQDRRTTYLTLSCAGVDDPGVPSSTISMPSVRTIISGTMSSKQISGSFPDSRDASSTSDIVVAEDRGLPRLEYDEVNEKCESRHFNGRFPHSVSCANRIRVLASMIPKLRLRLFSRYNGTYSDNEVVVAEAQHGHVARACYQL